ncbi:activator-dependent family glycosyltransferase [Actinomadura sp. KC345]|uniref:activator-dependent family glycosyltransferase n=1 Tax=Actinomadura sp. KC345 TaxID=2530371 RepID=UPI0024426953|nr:activator-dependent family glycosyltransferase [Actinomadura sp. KC345]
MFAVPPAKVHVYAQVPLAWALRAAGHEVCVASPPDVAGDIARTGLTAVPVGDALQPEVRISQVGEHDAEAGPSDGPGEAEWQQVLAGMAEFRAERLTHDHIYAVQTAWTMIFQDIASPRATDDLVAFARFWRPDLVIWDTLFFAGPVAARGCGAAHARLLFGLDLVARMRELYAAEARRRPPELREDPVGEWLGWTLARYGHEFDEEMVVGQWTIDPVLSSMRLPVAHRYVPVRHVPYNGQSVVPDWLGEPPERRRVCLTLGLSHREVLGGDRASVAELLAAVAEVDAEVVATLNADQLAGVSDVPGNVRAVDFVPMNELLPTCSAIVHQGGFGTLQTALAHGIPQVLLPNRLRDWDSLPWAERVQRSGAGLCAPDAQGVTAGGLRDMLARVLDDPSFGERAALLRTEMLGTPAPADIVPLLERLTAEHRR